MKRIIFIGQGIFGMNGLLSILNSPIKNLFKIVGVITTASISNTNPLKTLSSLYNLPIIESDENKESIINWIKKIHPDLGIIMEYPKKIPEELIDLFKDFIINVHPSDLPRYRGGAPLEGQILNEKNLVISIHKVTKEFDQGPILLKSLPINIEGLEIETIYKIISVIAPKLILKAIESICKNTHQFLPQNNSAAIYSWAYDLDHKLKINWSDNCNQIHKIILATYKNRGAIVKFKYESDELTLKIYSCFPIQKEIQEEPGKLLFGDANYLLITCGDGIIFVNEFSDLKNNRGKNIPESFTVFFKKMIGKPITWLDITKIKEILC